MTINFKVINHGSKSWEDAVHLRESILRQPPGKPFSTRELEEEKQHYHIIGSINNELVATAALVPEDSSIKMQRVVVAKNLRNLNIGSQMILFCEAFAKDKGYKVIYCHARDSAANFYLKNGYKGEGDYFEEDMIPHLKMSKNFT